MSNLSRVIKPNILSEDIRNKMSEFVSAVNCVMNCILFWLANRVNMCMLSLRTQKAVPGPSSKFVTSVKVFVWPQKTSQFKF